MKPQIPTPIFCHTVDPTRGKKDVNKVVSEIFFQPAERSINATIIFDEAQLEADLPGVSTFDHAFTKNAASILFRSGRAGALFLHFFPKDINSKNYIGWSDTASPLVAMQNIAKWTKNTKEWRLSRSWGDVSLISAIDKLREIGREERKPIYERFSNTEYFDQNGRPIKIASKQYITENQEEGRQLINHNECFIRVGLAHATGVMITKENWDRGRNVAGEQLGDLYDGYTYLNQRAITVLYAESLQAAINSARQAALNDEKQIEFMVNLEIERVANQLGKIALLQDRIAYHLANPSLENNELMQLAFASKKKKAQNFDELSEENQRIWRESNIEYLRREIAILREELNEQVSLYNLPGTDQLLSDFESKSSEEKFELIKAWQSTVSSESKQDIRTKISESLQVPLPICVYDMTQNSVNLVEVTQQDREINFEDPNVVRQALQMGIFKLLVDQAISAGKNEFLTQAAFQVLELARRFDGINDKEAANALKDILDTGLDLFDARDGSRQSIADIAIGQGLAEVVSMLCDKVKSGSVKKEIFSYEGDEGAEAISKIFNIDVSQPDKMRKILTSLAEAGIDIGARNKDGYSLLHHIVEKAGDGHQQDRKLMILSEIISDLVKDGKVSEEILIQDCAMKIESNDEPVLGTLAHYACATGNSKIFEVVKKMGFDFKRPNENGKTPFDIAAEKGFVAIAAEIDPQFNPPIGGADQDYCLLRLMSDNISGKNLKTVINIFRYVAEKRSDLEAEKFDGRDIFQILSDSQFTSKEWLIQYLGHQMSIIGKSSTSEADQLYFTKLAEKLTQLQNTAPKISPKETSAQALQPANAKSSDIVRH